MYYALAIIAALVVSFGTAFVWHLTIFKNLYERLGVLGRMQPIIPLGFVATLLLAIVMVVIYPHIYTGGDALWEGLRFGLVIGVLNIILWVLKFAATQPVSSISTFIITESAFELLQLGLIGIVIALIYAI